MDIANPVQIIPSQQIPGHVLLKPQSEEWKRSK